MIYIMIIWIAFGIACWSTDQKMKAWKKHRKSCLKKGIKPDQSIWIPR